MSMTKDTNLETLAKVAQEAYKNAGVLKEAATLAVSNHRQAVRHYNAAVACFDDEVAKYQARCRDPADEATWEPLEKVYGI